MAPPTEAQSGAGGRGRGQALGITGVSLDVNPGGQIPYDRVVHSIRLLTEKVIPKFK